jgi:hypothetical protein
VGRLTAEAQVRRDSDVVADRARGLTVPTIAANHSLSERHVWEILARRRRRQVAPPEYDPVGVALESVEQLDNRIEALALLADTASQESVQLGAIKTQLLAMRQRTELMQAVGLLPLELLDLREKLDIRQTVMTIVEFLRGESIADDAIRVLCERLESPVAVRQD